MTQTSHFLENFEDNHTSNSLKILKQLIWFFPTQVCMFNCISKILILSNLLKCEYLKQQKFSFSW
jgi:hypothetical protein